MSNLWKEKEISVSQVWDSGYYGEVKREFVKKRIFKKLENPKVEEKIEDIKFDIHKFTRRKKPSDPRRILIISCFSEFGCETIACLYCLPRIMKMMPDFYVIAIGWYGREYLYRHLVDEYWEVREEHQWLRDYTVAFHHTSKNLKKLEAKLRKSGVVVTSQNVGHFAVGNICRACRHMWGDIIDPKQCKKCNSTDLIPAVLTDVLNRTKEAVPLPRPSENKIQEAKKYINGENPVAIFARNRTTYGRNLQPEFYVKLVELLQSMGYSPIWLGEKQNTMKCPVDGIVDMSRKEEARDLELTLAIISQVSFTVQFWTASTRLAGMMGIPFLLFESPEQIYGPVGQEGLRLELTTLGKKKLCISHFLNVFNDNDAAIDLVRQSVIEMQENNWSDLIGLVDNKDTTLTLQKMYNNRVGKI